MYSKGMQKYKNLHIVSTCQQAVTEKVETTIHKLLKNA